ncbi:MAG: DUF3078 domain-containing protein [Prevotella sp.]|nr:DUF3078 domain-containing protein [Prevotella sp.]
MLNNILITLFLLMMAIPSKAQENAFSNRKSADKIEVSSFVKAYTDSLATVRQRLQTSSNTLRSSGMRGEFSQLFLPTTFYHTWTNEMMSIGGTESDKPLYNSSINSSLLDVYLKHPEWVLNTQKKMEKAGPADVNITTPIRQEAELVGKVEELPQTIDIVPMKVVVTKPNFWKIKGDYSLQFMQNYISDNWYKGGESSYAMLGVVTMEANYNNKQKVKWDNKLELKLGLQNTRSDTIHRMKTNEDLIRLTSKLGLHASKHWYYTLQLIAQTQFTHSYKSNDRTVYADFLAPGSLNLSLGMDYDMDWMNHKLKGTVHLAPIAYNLKYTRNLDLSTRLGIKEGRHALHDYGSLFTADLTWEFNDMLKWKTRMYGYTTYKNAVFEWENTFVFQLNKWLAAQLFVYPRFDDNVSRDDKHGYWQFKEFASIGFNYSF